MTKDSFLQEWRSVSVHLACPADFRRSDNDRLKLSKGAVQTSLRTLREQSMRKMATEADENVWVALRVLELADLEKPDQALAVIVKHHQSDGFSHEYDSGAWWYDRQGKEGTPHR